MRTLLVVVVALVCTSASLIVVQAAHSRSRIVVRTNTNSAEHYDRSITTFSNEGRLLQVEYGMEASQRGATAAVMKIPNTEEHEDETILIVVPSSLDNTKMHRIDEHIWLIATGLSGDARFVMGDLRVFCQNHLRQLGERPTVQEVAQRAAHIQHLLTHLEGYRPLGVTCFLVGADPHYGSDSDEKSSGGCLRIFQTDPGGIMEEYNYCAAGKGREAVLRGLSETYEKYYAKAANPQELVKNLLKATIRDFDLKGDDATLDVFAIQPRRRLLHIANTAGDAVQLKTRCFLGANKQNYHRIVDHLTEEKQT